MGFQVRKRTKGKTSWLNFSFSKRRGFGASASLKVGENVTYNTRGRLTINLGSGMKYVFYKKKPKQAITKSQKTNTSTAPIRANAPVHPCVIQYKRAYVDPIEHDRHLEQIQELLLEIRKMKGLKKTVDFEALGNLNRAVSSVRASGCLNLDSVSINAAAQRFEIYARKTESADLIDAAVAIREMLESLQ